MYKSFIYCLYLYICPSMVSDGHIPQCTHHKFCSGKQPYFSALVHYIYCTIDLLVQTDLLVLQLGGLGSEILCQPRKLNFELLAQFIQVYFLPNRVTIKSVAIHLAYQYFSSNPNTALEQITSKKMTKKKSRIVNGQLGPMVIQGLPCESNKVAQQFPTLLHSVHFCSLMGSKLSEPFGI